MNASDTHLLNTITAAARTLTDPTSASAAVHQASATLSNLNPSLSSLLPLSGTLLTSPNTALIFHNLLTRQLHPSIYATHPKPLKTALLQLSTRLLHSPTRSSTYLHAALAVREWPQNWPSFLTDLLPTKAACAVLADLSDAVFVHPGVSSNRREEIIHCLALQINDVLPVIIERLPDAHAWRAAEAFMPWVTVDTLFSSGLVENVLKYLITDSWREAILALTGLVERRVEVADTAFRELYKRLLAIVEGTDQVLTYMAFCRAPPGGEMPRLRQAWDKTLDSNPDEQVHAFVHKFFQLLSDLGVAHFTRCFMYSKRGAVKLSQSDAIVAAAFVDLLLAGLSHPSTMLRLAVLPFFTSLLAALQKSGHRSLLVSYLTQGYFHAASAALLPTVFMKHGYDDDISHEAANHNFVARLSAGLSTTAKISPGVGALAFARLRELLGMTPKPEGKMLQPSQGHAWVFANPAPPVWEGCLEGASMAADAVASGVTKDGLDTLLAEMRTCYESLLSLSDPLLQSFRANAVRSFVVLFRTDPNALDRCVEVLGSLIGQGRGRVRSRVCSSLSTIFRRCDNAGIGKYAGSLCEYCLRALGEDFHTVEKIHLVEATLSSVQALQVFEERLMYVERVLLPVLDVLAKPDMMQTFASPRSFFEFLDRASIEQAAPVVGAFLVLETSSHHLVRAVSKTTGPIPLPGVLSRSVAPKSVDVACRLISCLHGMYNTDKFPVDTHADVLHPTSREVAYLLNLDPQKAVEQPAQGEKRASLAEQRAAETLLSHGVDPPDSTQSWLRETLRDLRRSAYEILRAAILSGVTQSPAHLKALVEAVCSDFEYIEPLHLLLLISRVLNPLVSHAVVTAGPAYLESLAGSSIPALMRHIRQHINACQKGKTAFSSSATLDIARDHARRTIARTAADMLALIYPRREPTKAEENKDIPEYSPLVFKAGQLGVELALLWQTICNPGQSRLDQGASRVGFALIVTAADMAPPSEFAFFAPLLHGSLRTAVLNASMDVEDSPTQSAISAVLAVMRKWPAESEQAMHTLGDGDVKRWVSEAVKEVQKAKPKKQRTAVKALVERLAEVEGTKENKGEVQALPQKLVTVNPARAKNKPRNELEEIVLGDTALDSLFGEGEPL